jgi:hypothetical protein
VTPSGRTEGCGSLTARTLAYVCNRINDVELTIQCFEAGRDALLDECALGACDRYNDAPPTVQCIRAISGREYTLEEVLACDRITDVDQTTRCFAAAGRSARLLNPSEVHYRVLNALNLLQDGRSTDAESELQSLLDYVGRNP